MVGTDFEFWTKPGLKWDGMFRGRHEYTLDEKGRVSVPTRFREAIEKDSSEPTTLIITNFDKCLVAYTMEEWTKLEEKIMSLPQFDPRTISFQRFFISSANECSIDKAGRILIPQTLRQYAAIDREIIMLGAINKFEIWSKARWIEEESSISGNLGEFAAAASAHGIRL
jgi:MraZ protein